MDVRCGNAANESVMVGPRDGETALNIKTLTYYFTLTAL